MPGFAVPGEIDGDQAVTRSTVSDAAQSSVIHRLCRSPGCQSLTPTGVDEEDQMKTGSSQDAVKGSSRKAVNFAEDRCCHTQAVHADFAFSKSMTGGSLEHVDISLDTSQGTMTDRSDKGVSLSNMHGSVLEQIHEIISQLKMLLKQDIAKLKADFERRLCVVEDTIVEGVKLRHHLMQTSVDTKLCAIEDNTHEHARMIVNIESRLSAIEECMFCCPEFAEVTHQHSIVQKDKCVRMRTICRHKSDQREEITNLTTIPEDSIAEDPVVGISLTRNESEQENQHGNSKSVFEH